MHSTSGTQVTVSTVSEHARGPNYELGTIDEPIEYAEDLSDYPDGGKHAWLVVFGVWCALFPTFAIMNITGILQEWLEDNQLKDRSTASVSWIFSLYNCLFWLGGIQVGPIFDSYGLKYTFVPGCVGMCAAIMALSVSEEYYQFILGFSILGGLSSSAILTPSLGSINHWYLKRRGLATGIATTSGGIGSILFSALMGELLKKIGFPWTIRVLGFISILFFAVGLVLVRTRLPPNKKSGSTMDLRCLREPVFTVASVAVSFAEVGMMVVITYLPSYASSHGVTGSLSYNLMSIFSATLILGRVIPGLVADHWGRYNVMIVTGSVSMLLVLALWMKAGEDTAAIVTFAAFFGFWSSPAVGLSPVCIAQISRTEDYGKRYGTTTAIFGLAILVSIPIAGEILGAQNPGKSGEETDYSGLVMFCGAAYATSTVLLVVTKIISKLFTLLEQDMKICSYVRILILSDTFSYETEYDDAVYRLVKNLHNLEIISFTNEQAAEWAEWLQSLDLHYLSLDGIPDTNRLIAHISGCVSSLKSFAVRVPVATDPLSNPPMLTIPDGFFHQITELRAFTAYDLSKEFLRSVAVHHGHHIRQLRFRRTRNIRLPGFSQDFQSLFTPEELKALSLEFPLVERLGIDLYFEFNLPYKVPSSIASFASLKYLELNKPFKIPFTQSHYQRLIGRLGPWINTSIAEQIFNWVSDQKEATNDAAISPVPPLIELHIKVSEWEPPLKNYQTFSRGGQNYIFGCWRDKGVSGEIHTLRLPANTDGSSEWTEDNMYEQTMYAAGLWDSAKADFAILVSETLLALGPSQDEELVPHSRLTKTWALHNGSAGYFSIKPHGILSNISKLSGMEIAFAENLKGLYVSGKKENDIEVWQLFQFIKKSQPFSVKGLFSICSEIRAVTGGCFDANQQSA
ncbi:MCT family MFS transporter [Aspergillus affinis]|uniref:MCT family MFS transporter n=1 Tax=Aspergillus affinis TaxID=1070780 RepID=UPI0022FF45B3|nr:monocarboxylate permease [Aspergillus affinis]KAI9040866.1 monocarboxylate permease [Aspergillus affinis]